MKKQSMTYSLIISLFLMLGLCAKAQDFVTVSGTIVDSDSQVWFGGSWSAQLNNPRGGPVNFIDGTTPVVTQFSGSLDGSGTFSQSNIPNNAALAPSGTFWTFRFCPYSSAGCTSMPNVSFISGQTTFDISTLATANIIAPRFSALGHQNWGYSDGEISTIPNPGGIYFNVTLALFRYWNGTIWVSLTGGGGTCTDCVLYDPTTVNRPPNGDQTIVQLSGSTFTLEDLSTDGLTFTPVSSSGCGIDSLIGCPEFYMQLSQDGSFGAGHYDCGFDFEFYGQDINCWDTEDNYQINYAFEGDTFTVSGGNFDGHSGGALNYDPENGIQFVSMPGFQVFTLDNFSLDLIAGNSGVGIAPYIEYGPTVNLTSGTVMVWSSTTNAVNNVSGGTITLPPLSSAPNVSIAQGVYQFFFNQSGTSLSTLGASSGDTINTTGTTFNFAAQGQAVELIGDSFTRNWAVVGAGSSSSTGTVTSVAETVPSGFAVSGTPITTSGTLGITYSVAASGEIIDSSAANTAGFTATPILGASGTLGSLTLGNATSGLITIVPVTGALGTVTASLPANTGIIAELNLAQSFSARQTFPGGDLFFGGVNAQTGTSYTFLTTDENKLVTFSNASAIAVTLPVATTTGFTSGAVFSITNLGAGKVTITPTTSTINGAATLVLPTGESADIFSDGTNYQAQVSVSPIGSVVLSPSAQQTISSTSTSFVPFVVLSNNSTVASFGDIGHGGAGNILGIGEFSEANGGSGNGIQFLSHPGLIFDESGLSIVAGTVNTGSISLSAVGGPITLTAGSSGFGSSDPVDLLSAFSRGTAASGDVVEVGGGGTSYEITDCPLNCTTAIGVVTNGSGSASVLTVGSATVNLDASSTISVGDYVCSPTVTAGKGHWNGTVPCRTQAIGTVLTAATSVTTASIWVLPSTGQTPKSQLTSTYTNATATPSTIWSFAVAASTNYQVTCTGVYKSASGGAFELTATGPASPTNVSYSFRPTVGLASAAPTDLVYAATGTSYPSGINATAITTAATDMPFIIEFNLNNGTTAGTLAIQGNTISTDTLTVEIGSTCTIN